MFGLGIHEVLVIALIILLLFGKGVKNFKDGMREIDDDSEKKKDE